MINRDLFDFEVCELVCGVLSGFICGNGCAKIFDFLINILSIEPQCWASVSVWYVFVSNHKYIRTNGKVGETQFPQGTRATEDTGEASRRPSLYRGKRIWDMHCTYRMSVVNESLSTNREKKKVGECNMII